MKGEKMPKIIDTEGFRLIGDLEHWNLHLLGGDGCYISLSVPYEIGATDNDCPSVLSVDLRPVLDETLDEHLDGRDAECLRALAQMFREYAEKYDAAAVAILQKPVPDLTK